MRAPACAAILATVVVCAWRPAAQSPAAFVIRDVRVFDGERVLERQTLVVGDGRITAVNGSGVALPPGVETIDGTGRTLLPGLIDAHVHLPIFGAEQALQQTLAFGVTTAINMWTGAPPPGFTGTSAVARQKQIAATDSPALAWILTAGTGATAKGGHPAQMEGPQSALGLATVNAPGEADAFVAARLADGSDFLKIIYDDVALWLGKPLPRLSEEVVAALVSAAHARGKLAVAHIGAEREARSAVSVGVDGLAHIFTGPPPAADFARLVRARGTFVIPTLTTLYWGCGRSDGPGLIDDPNTMRYVREQFRSVIGMADTGPARSCDGADQAVRQLVAERAAVIAGTDAPAPGTTYGASLHRELEHLVALGMTPVQALAAATAVPARAFRMNDRGSIRPGLRADLLLVDGDPTRDIRATRSIARIWNRGTLVAR